MYVNYMSLQGENVLDSTYNTCKTLLYHIKMMSRSVTHRLAKHAPDIACAFPQIRRMSWSRTLSIPPCDTSLFIPRAPKTETAEYLADHLLRPVYPPRAPRFGRPGMDHRGRGAAFVLGEDVTYASGAL